VKSSSRNCARVLVCGTLAYDVIGRTPDRLQPGVRNVKLDGLLEDFGGCAMNIAYTLRQLGHEPVALAYVGDDFAPAYANHLAAADLRTDGLIHVTGARCARGITLTDPHGEQFTAFFPGPTGLDRLAADIEDLCRRETFDAVVLATDLPEKTVAAAAVLHNVPLRIWCPGQYAQHFGPDDAARLIAWADLIILNRFEWRTLYQRLKRGASERLEAGGRTSKPGVIVTRGAGSVVIWSPGAPRASIPVPTVTSSRQRDPTGCGDALSAGVIAGLLEQLSVTLAVERGVAVAQLCLQESGTQHHLKDPPDGHPL
jgi:adenosine kinase